MKSPSPLIDGNPVKARRQSNVLTDPTTADQLPPHSSEAEQGVLGCILHDPKLLPKVRDAIVVEAFFELRHRQIFVALIGLADTGVAIDPITLHQFLKDRKQFENIGGLPYLASLLDATPSGAHSDHYVAIVRDKFLLRTVLAAASDLARDIRDHPNKGHLIIDQHRSTLDWIRDTTWKTQGWRVHAQDWSVERLQEPIVYSQNLLGERFLERGGTMAVVAPSGVGKSVASVQMAASWSIGRPAFHIKPSAPLRVLIVQNEDSMSDIKGPLQGVIQNLGFSGDEMKLLNANLKVVRLVALRGKLAADAISDMAIEWNADLIILNPLMAYVPGKQGDETEVFIREHLQPIATDLNIGIVAIHHTPKIGRMNGVGTGANEFERQYNSAGKAEVVNAFRGIINIMPVGNGVFRFTADKRGRKIGWTRDGTPTIELYFKHAADPDNADLVWWEDATPEEAEQAAVAGVYQDILMVLPAHDEGPISRERIRVEAKRRLKVGKNTADDWLKLALEDALAVKVDAKNENGRNEAFFRRAEGVAEAFE